MMRQSIISDQDKAQLKRTFRKDLKGEVPIRLFTTRPTPLTIPGRECAYCAQTQQLMEDLSALSPKLRLEIVDFFQQPQVAREHGVERIPAIVLGADGSSRLKFYGIPMGYELAAVIEGIKNISRGVSPLAMETRKMLRQVNQPVRLQVFVTPTCQYCPLMARLAHAFALASPHVTAEVIEIQEFPALAQFYAVRSVPLTVINEHIRLTGAVPEAQLLERVLQAGYRPAQQNGDGEA